MEVSNSLLVAIMFVTLLSIGIGNILMSLGSMVDPRSPIRASGRHLSWILLLLVIYFRLFWHTLDVMSIESWVFVEFLFIIAGPILVLFATQVLLPQPGEPDGDPKASFFEISRPFFLLLAGTQAWMVGVDLVLGEPGLATIGSSIAGAAAVFLALSRRDGVHRAGAVFMWLLLLVALALRAMGVIG